MCFGKTTIQQATPPPAPTIASSTQDYVNALPALQQAELEYAPKFAAQEYDLAKQYYPEYTKLMQETEAGLYPETAALQESLAKKAREGMDAAVPESMTTAYLDNLRSELGTNVGSGIGADYTSRGLIDLQQNYNRYYNDLGLSITGRLPLQQTATPAFAKTPAGFDPNSAMNFNQQGFGTAANMFSNQYKTNTEYATARRGQNFGLISSGIGAASTLGTAAFCWVASEIYGGWNEPRTVKARFYVANQAPNWFREFYIKHGQSIAKFISNKPLLKKAIKPLFDYFVKEAGK